MPVRQDKFAVGDKVRLHPDYVKTAFSIRRGSFPYEDTTYTICKVVDVPFQHDDPQEQSNHEGMAHTQHVDIEEDPTASSGYPKWSGAFWKKVSEDDLH